MNCISCGESSFVIYSEDSNMNLPVYRCKSCGLFVTGSDEKKIKEIAKKIYTTTYWEERQASQSLESDFKDKISQYKWKHWNSQLKYCSPQLDKKGDLLEIGSGAGQTLVYFEKLGFNVTGLEPDKRNADSINQKLKHGKCISGFVEDTQIEGRFDVIWINHVLEHLIRPDLFLARCKSNLCDNGFIFIEVPECENPQVLKASVYENPSTFHFTKKTLMNVIKNAGYKVIRCDSLRVPSLSEAGMWRIMKKCKFLPIDIYPYYPKLVTNKNDGEVIRTIISK
ncbi:MAG: class I SAM-dependent methyltransferase [Thaumarchaeota archaeon]|nr:class I SAM-dependent methyltransferase [Nitrososphaerota archaeon]